MKNNLRIYCLVISVFLLLIFTRSNESYAQQQEGPNNCYDCHLELEDGSEGPATHRADDIHFQNGINCVDCHGGDSMIDPEGDMELAMNPSKGFAGAIKRTDIPKFCDKCHGNADYMKNYNPNLRLDQLQRYSTSTHGTLLSRGDEKVAVCSDCHSVHQMKAINNPLSKVFPLNVNDTCGRCHSDPDYMQPYGIPTDQAEEYKKSVHYQYLSDQGDMSAPTCNDCHGNHGAIPPGFESIHNVCGSCHISNKELFDQSRHFEVFKDMDMPECVTCHSNHSIQRTGEHMLAENGGVCWDCHDTDSNQGQQILIILNEIESIKQQYARADSLITLAARKGMEVQEYEVELIDLASSITKMRNLVHKLSLADVQAEAEAGKELSGRIIAGGIDSMEEISQRRLGLLVALICILFLIVSLFIKIRSMPET